MVPSKGKAFSYRFPKKEKKPRIKRFSLSDDDAPSKLNNAAEETK